MPVRQNAASRSLETMTAPPLRFDDLHTQLRPQVVRYLARYVGEAEAEDLAQEVFLKVHQGLETFRGEAKPATWIFQIATFAALDRLKSASHRATRAEVSGPLLEDHGAFALDHHGQQPIKDEMCRCIRSLVDDLPLPQRTILYLSELEELRLEAIAQILGITPGAAKIRLHRARRILKARMERHCQIVLNENADLHCDRKPAVASP